MSGVIYCIKTPDGKRYIGKTWEFERRMQYHKRNKDTNCTALKDAVSFFGWEDCDVETICRGIEDPEELDEAEKETIKKYDSNSPEHGYNCSSGGDKGFTWNEETREKISNGMKKYHAEGAGHTEEAKKKISESLKEYKRINGISEEHRKNLSNALKGRKFTDEWKKNIGSSSAGRQQSEETKMKKAEAQKRTNKLKRQQPGGFTLSTEARKNMSEAAKKRRPPTCRKCNGPHRTDYCKN